MHRHPLQNLVFERENIVCRHGQLAINLRGDIFKVTGCSALLKPLADIIEPFVIVMIARIKACK